MTETGTLKTIEKISECLLTGGAIQLNLISHPNADFIMHTITI